jgi:hypothetical protein
MKPLVLSIVLINLFSSHSVFANKEVGNGGDICEDRIKIIRDDIASWIKQGGPDGLTLPEGVSVSQYDTEMLAAISTAKISCIDAEVTVDNTEKTCKNLRDSNGTPKVICNEKRFLETDDSDQYVLVHHEYASLAGIEISNGADSNYTISNQISEYLVDEVVKKLAVKRPPVSAPGETPYQTLKDAFDAAGPAQITDFPTLADMLEPVPPLLCAAAGPASPMKNYLVLGQVDLLIPSGGPLFPGKTVTAITPLETTSVANQTLSFGHVYPTGVDTLETTTDSSGDLRSEYTVCSKIVSDSVFRKNGDMLLIHETGSISSDGSCKGTVSQIDEYGYCFPPDSVENVPDILQF